MDSHEKVIREKGLSEEAVLAAIRLTSVVRALATVFDTERAGAAQAVST
jgi:alkyl hydroperoxide reductase subunit D